MRDPRGKTLWEMLTQREEQVTAAVATPTETKPHVFNPLGLNLGDVARVVLGAERYRFQVVEVDEFDRGSWGKIADYRLFQKADPSVPGSEGVDRYLRVFPSKTPDGQKNADLLLLTWLFRNDYDPNIPAMLERNEFPIQGDEYAGFARNQGTTLPYSATVTEIKVDEPPKIRRMKYWDFVRPNGGSFDAFFIEMDEDTLCFDAYSAVPVEGSAISFLKKQ